jgi:hypothetical protein
MGEIKISLEAESKADEALDASAKKVSSDPAPANALSAQLSSAPGAKADGTKQENASVTLKPDQGAEIKAVMKKGAKIEYKWVTDGGKANFDVHGDSKAQNIKYHNYEKGSEQEKNGFIVAAFDGNHGWFWRNRTGKTLTVSLEVTGDFESLKRME